MYYDIAKNDCYIIWRPYCPALSHDCSISFVLLETQLKLLNCTRKSRSFFPTSEKNNNNKTRPNLSLNLCGIYISQKWPEPNSWVNQGQHKKWLLKTLLIWWIKITISLLRILYSLLILFSGDAGCGCQWRLARYSHQYLQPGADDCPGPLAAWLLITDAATYRTTRPLSVQVKKYFNTGTANMCEKSILASSSRLLICLVVPPGCV